MEDSTKKKFDRILSILLLLQSKRITKARDLADRFDVSVRTIYRDMKTLEQSGVPVLGSAGSGYTIMEGYKIPPIMFTTDETSSLVAAEKLMTSYSDRLMSVSFSTAVAKIKAILKWGEKDRLTSMDAYLQVKPNDDLPEDLAPNAISAILESIANQKIAKMHYKAFDADTPSDRRIEPIGLYHEHGYWYLLAYCHLREAYRKFRTDRIFKIQTTEAPYVLNHPTLDFLLQENKESQEESLKIVLIVNRFSTRFMQYSKKFHGFQNEEVLEDTVRMYFSIAPNEIDYFARWFLMFGDCATIESPEILKGYVKQLIENISTYNGLE